MVAYGCFVRRLLLYLGLKHKLYNTGHFDKNDNQQKTDAMFIEQQINKIHEARETDSGMENNDGHRCVKGHCKYAETLRRC